jgi:Tfp pilus assembly protein PilN
MKQHISDPFVFQKIEKGFIKRARITAIVLGSFLVVALIAVVYGFVQNVKAQEAEKTIISLQQEVEAATAEARTQAALAIESKLIAEEAAKFAYEELEECRKKK